MSIALLTDLYELNMAASYLRRGMDQPATVSLFVRELPADRGYLVAAGVDSCLDIEAARARLDADLALLPESALRLRQPVPPQVRWSEGLTRLTERVSARLGEAR